MPLAATGSARRVSARVIARAFVSLLACAMPLQAQTPGSGASPRPAANVRPEESAAARLQETGKPREALVELDRAAAAYRRAGDNLGLARVALKRSAARRVLGQLDEAARDAEEARTYGQTDPALLLQALTLISRTATDRSDFTRAADAARESVSIAQRIGDPAAQARALRTLGLVAERQGRQHEALEHLTEAVRAADRTGEASLRVLTRGSAITVLLGLSRYDAALSMAQESFEIGDRSGVPGARANSLFDLSQASAHVWNLDRAAGLWQATIEAQRQVGNEVLVALSQKQSVETWFALGEFDRAAADGEIAVDLLQKTGQRQYVAETMARVALSQVRRGQRAEARRWADAARAALPAAPESRHLFVHNDLGIVEAELGELARARADYARVLDVAQQVGNVDYEWRAQWGFGRTALRDRPADAIVPLERAIAIVERLRQTIPEAGQRAAFMINRVGPYETLAEAHMALASTPADEHVRRAFEVAERARSRALADLLAEARARIADPRVAAVRDQEAAFGRRFSEVQKRAAAAADSPARADALEALRDLEREYEAFVLRIRRDNPAYAALAHSRALAVADVGAMLAADEALIEFLITDTQGFAWVIRRDAVLGYRVPGRNALDRHVRLLGALLAARDDAAIRRAAAQLYTSLLGPAADALRGARRLVVVSDGPLQRVPFALLRSDDGWLVDTHAITLAPSATILHRLRQLQPTRAPEPLLALAVPDAHPGQTAIFDGGTSPIGTLTHVMGEVANARRLVGATPDSAWTAAAATEHALKASDAGRYRILHFATHAIADEVVPRRSAIVLTPDGQEDGLLQVSEIANLSLNADLVVLAACRSHVGRLVRAEGLLGLSRAFIHAGARAVVATAWSVPDRETAWLMRRFYTALADGLAPDEALRRAQREAIGNGGAPAAPHVWAAFVAFGDARTPILDASPQSTLRAWSAAIMGGLTALVVIGAIITAAARRRAGARPSSHAEARGR
jgi:CHAT domain-containing protein